MSEVTHYVQGAGRWGSWLTYRLADDLDLDFGGVLEHGTSARVLARDHNVPLVRHPLPVDRPSVLWLCVPDDAVAPLVAQLPYGAGGSLAVVHSSGTIPLPEAPFPTGVAWPIQSITHEAEPDWAQLPLVIQASDAAFAKTLHAIATQISGLSPKLVTTDAERQRLHLAATLTQNFGNLLWTLAEQVLAKAGLDYRDLLPLAENHLAKLATTPPQHLQTGPAVRGDEVTLRGHRELLSGHPAAAEAYELLTRLIRERTRA